VRTYARGLRRTSVEFGQSVGIHLSSVSPRHSYCNWASPVTHGYKPEKINTKPISCSECLEVGRSTTKVVERRREPLSKLSKNIVRKGLNSNGWKRKQRAPRTTFGCQLCQIPLCKEGDC
jgi:hypothetical protein